MQLSNTTANNTIERKIVMAINYNDLKKQLAEHKVYDAWQYVCSLLETVDYMNLSYDLLQNVYNHRVSALDNAVKEVVSTAAANKGTAVAFTEEHLKRTHFNIVQYDIDDSLFLRKTALEFFHYARLSIDVLYQIINSSLFGDSALKVNEYNLPKKVTEKLGDTPCFNTMKSILTNGISKQNIEYLIAFDNYIKHIKTILITINNSILLGHNDKFEINEFCYKGITYSKVDVIQKVTDVKSEVDNLIDSTLTELFNQIPNCIDNDNRYQKLRVRMICKEKEDKSCIEYITYLIEVNREITELPSEIKVMPLLIDSNGEVYSYVLDLNEIFVCVKDKGESGIIGMATAKQNVDSNEIYRSFEVKPCTIVDYYNYISNFTTTYSNHHMNFNAIEGELISYKDKNV